MRIKLNKEANEFEEAKEDEQSDLTIDNFLLSKMQNVEKLKSKNWDCMFIIVGDEGSGKSTLAFILGQYLTKMSLSMDNIANHGEEAIEKLNKLPDGSTIILDEAELLFSSRDTMTKEQRQLTKIMMIIRQKRMTLILVTPEFFELSKYVAVKRSRFLIRVYANGLERGNWAYWGTRQKARLYYEGKKNYGSYLRPRPQIHGQFVNYVLPFDEEYKRVKLDTLMKSFDKEEKKKRTKKKPKVDDDNLDIDDM